VFIEVTAERLQRTILAATFAGNVSIRPTQILLQEAFDQIPSIGSISQLRLESGCQAGRVLAGLDYSRVGDVIVGRDETFFQGIPLLLVIEPVSSTILLALACRDRQADTWGAALELVQEQGVSIVGLPRGRPAPMPNPRNWPTSRQHPCRKIPGISCKTAVRSGETWSAAPIRRTQRIKCPVKIPGVFCPIEFLRPNPDVEVYEVPRLLDAYFFESA
jgi:hypothetical protein